MGGGRARVDATRRPRQVPDAEGSIRPSLSTRCGRSRQFAGVRSSSLVERNPSGDRTPWSRTAWAASRSTRPTRSTWQPCASTSQGPDFARPGTIRIVARQPLLLYPQPSARLRWIASAAGNSGPERLDSVYVSVCGGRHPARGTGSAHPTSCFAARSRLLRTFRRRWSSSPIS